MAPELIFRGSVKQVDSLLCFPKGFYEDSQHRLWLGDNRKIYRFANDKVRSYFPGDKAVTNGLYEISNEGPTYNITPLEEIAEKNINIIEKGSEGTI
jgi:hypothetical protein